MKTLKEYIGEGILSGRENIKSNIEKDIIVTGLLSDNKEDQENAIAAIHDILKNEKQLKTCGKFEKADSNMWYVKLPQYKGYSDDILFGHRVGSNHCVYRIPYNKNTTNKLFKMVVDWKEIYGNLSPRNNFVYLAPQELCDIFKQIENTLIGK
jgi:hypothetical protein